MIPVLICPVLNRFDLLERMLLSTQYPIEQVLIVDNSCSGYTLPREVQSKLQTENDIGYIRPFTGLGYGGAINQGIMQTAYADWWMWSSNDIVYGMDDLAMIDGKMLDAWGPVFISYGFIYGAINSQAIDKVGLVDEWEFFPIYEDDIDYYRRLRLAGVQVVDYRGAMTHGDNGVGSLTIRSDDNAKRANSGSHGENTKRYIAKWGGIKGQEKFDTPFDANVPLWYTKPDIRARARRMW